MLPIDYRHINLISQNSPDKANRNLQEQVISLPIEDLMLNNIQNSIDDLWDALTNSASGIPAINGKLADSETGLAAITGRVDELASYAIKTETATGTLEVTAADHVAEVFGDVDGPLMHVSVSLFKTGDMGSGDFEVGAYWLPDNGNGMSVARYDSGNPLVSCETVEFNASYWIITAYPDGANAFDISYAATMTYLPEP